MAKKTGRPTWFKMFLHQKAIVDSVGDETAGKALKAVFQYFDTGEIAELDQEAFIVFSAIKPYIDESFADFNIYSAAGKKGMDIRWGKSDNPLITPFNPLKGGITPSNEAEAEAEADTEADTEAEGESKADKPPIRVRFSPPSVEDVRTYCKEQGYAAVDPERFVDYYASNGWMVGKNKMKDWKAAVRGWNSREAATPVQKKILPFPDVPTL